MNLSQKKRQRMLEFLERIRDEHKDDDETLIAINEIESELNSKKYGLVLIILISRWIWLIRNGSRLMI